ncbi:MAG: relaxase/mobilization nuclease domain-containing protein, partial [Lachnospiraceae bacterium]|nr:relaxase/mobilization nuclease domain-containing protein [Lachnospiraceae bacterium]
MAITKIHAIRSSIQKAVDYICNPDKTEGALLVDSFACNYHTAEPEFLMALSQGTGQGNKLAFHLIQSFAPGEVDAGTAHEIGEKLAERLLKGNYSYVIATHTDKHSVHNHIIFCAVDNFTHRKYYDNKKTYHEIRKLSDMLCHEYGLSVIEEKSGKRGLSYEEWMSQDEGRSWKARLKNDIRQCIKYANTYDDFIMLMKDLGYEVKGEVLQADVLSASAGFAGINNDSNRDDSLKIPKYISFKAPGQSHFIRGSIRGLGKGFSKEEIAEAIEKQAKIRAMEAPIPVKKIEDLLKKTAPNKRLIDRSGDKFKEKP